MSQVCQTWAADATSKRIVDLLYQMSEDVHVTGVPDMATDATSERIVDLLYQMSEDLNVTGVPDMATDATIERIVGRTRPNMLHVTDVPDTPIACKKDHGIKRGRKKTQISPETEEGGTSVRTDVETDSSALIDTSIEELEDPVPEGAEETSDTSSQKDESISVTTELTEASPTCPGVKIVKKICRSYSCPKCSFESKRSRDFLYHSVEVHNSRISIYACQLCDYCSQYRQKLKRHMHKTHGLIDFEYSNIKGPEHQGLVGPEKLPKHSVIKPGLKVKAVSKKSLGSKHGLGKKKLKVKFRPKQILSESASASVSKERQVSPSNKPIPQKTDQLSRVVEEVVGDDGQLVFKCKECQYTGDDKQAVAKHAVSWHVDTKSFSCSYCDYITFERNDLISHNPVHRNEHQFKCDECTYSTDFRPNYDRHLQNHKGNYPFKCTKCTYGCGSDAVLKRHLSSNHDPLPVPPPAKKMKLHVPVPKQANSMSVVPPPLAKPTKTSPRQNSGASGSPVTKNDNMPDSPIKMDAETIAEVNSYIYFDPSSASMVPRPSLPPFDSETATQLARELSPSRKLPPNIIQYVEKSEDKLVCPACKLKYKRSSDLNRHMKTKHAKWISDLKRHFSCHSLEKRYKCNFCPKKYKYRSDLNVHVRKEHNREPSGEVKVVKVATMPRKKTSPAMFKCPCCTYISPWKSEIDRHSRIHNTEKTFQCNNCEYQTYWRSDIRRHIYKKHPEIMAEGLTLNDVIITRKVSPPAIVVTTDDKTKGDASMLSSEGESSRETTPVKYGSRETTPEVNMSDYITTTHTGHSPTPSPIKEVGKGWYKCQYCGFETNAPSKMNAHIATHTNLKRYMCPICGRRANWKWDIAKHIKLSHRDETTQVIKLSKKEAEDTIQVYMEANPVVRRDHHLNLTPERELTEKSVYFKCPFCSFSDERRISVNRHMRSAHEGQEGTVVVLAKKEKHSTTEVKTSTQTTSTPIQMHTPSKFMHLVDNKSPQDVARPFMCSECGKRGATKGDVKKHYHYAHSDKEIRIVYLGDGSQSVIPANHEASNKSLESKPQSHFHETTSVMTSTQDMPAPKAGPSKDPKKIGYIRPFQCGLCGRRSNWRWDVNRHIRERHPDMVGKVKIIELSEDEARATIEKYTKEQLPTLNRTAFSVPRKRHSVFWDKYNSKSLNSSQSESDSSFNNSSFSEMNTSQNSVDKSSVAMETQHSLDLSQPVFPGHPARTFHENMQVSSTNTSTSPRNTFADALKRNTYKQYKCSGCCYRSDYRGDIMRHLVRRHGPNRAKVVILDKETAMATIGSYKYSKHEADKAERAAAKGEIYHPSPPRTFTPAGPLPKEAWAGLEKKLWKCSMCPYSDEDKVDVLKHLSKHNMKAYKCGNCNWTSNFKSAVDRHIQSKHDKTEGAMARLNIKLIKEGPGLDQTGRSIMPQGMATGEPNAISSEIEAPVPVTGQESMTNPQAVMSTAVFHCKLCNHSSVWRSCVSRHLKSVHKVKDYVANIVKKIVRTNRSDGQPGSLKDQQVWARPKNFSCHMCPYKTYKGKMLNFHISCHKPQPGVKQVKCKYCPYYVSSNRLLTQHVYLHLNEFKNSQESQYPVTPVKNKSGSPAVGVRRSPPINKRHRCEKCPYSTNSKNDFLYHKQFHRPKPTADYKCDYCDYWVSHRRLIKQHMKVHEEGYSVETSDVEVTPSKSDYSENSLVYDTVEIAAIKQRIIASKITPTISSSPLVSPMKIASTCSMGGKRGFLRKDGTYRKIHQCRHCPYMNLKLRNMRLHELMHGKRSSRNPLMKCPMCDYYVASRGLLGQHMKVHRPNYGHEFLQHGNMRMGNESVGSEDSEVDNSISLEKKIETLLQITRFKKFGCEKCPYASSKRARFQRHVELHGSKQKFKCDFCDYSVPTQNLLNQHTRLHFEPNQNLLAAQSILNLQCLPEMPADVALASMMANKDAKNPVSITHDHIELYENQTEDLEPKKLYRCDRCPYANVRRDHLLAHLRCHMVKHEFACPYCDYSVGKTHVLVQHVKVHFSPLPELSEWLAENGDTERMKELKGKNYVEAIEVVKLFHDGKKMEINVKAVIAGNSDSAEVENNSTQKKKENEQTAADAKSESDIVEDNKSAPDESKAMEIEDNSETIKEGSTNDDDQSKEVNDNNKSATDMEVENTDEGEKKLEEKDVSMYELLTHFPYVADQPSSSNHVTESEGNAGNTSDESEASKKSDAQEDCGKAENGNGQKLVEENMEFQNKLSATYEPPKTAMKGLYLIS
ncbi:ZN845-like protein [Mya arenaria]|uniref:ZN845-like protein n=1 Tax=Mya arenaria TaxID=6604 RepID=A0ABY7ERV6_MYAAR|nr:ZN845-like protein [Mya arenaria]